MKIAVLSDIHDHQENLKKAISKIKEEGINKVIFCGDMDSFYTAKVLVDANFKLFAISGNAESDVWMEAIKDDGVEIFSQEFGEVVLHNKKIAFTHYPINAKQLAASGYYDAVFYGHSHIMRKELVGNTILANPGTVCGIVKGKKGRAGFLIYNTEENELKFVNI